MHSILIKVPGAPVPQGSVVAHAHRRKDGSVGASVHYATGTHLHKWRNSIGRAAREAWGEGAETIGPVSLQISFVMERPLSHYSDLQGLVKTRYLSAEPTAPPDLDKLCRAVLDALTGIVYVDDSQVTEIETSKRFGIRPSATIEVRWNG